MSRKLKEKLKARAARRRARADEIAKEAAVDKPGRSKTRVVATAFRRGSRRRTIRGVARKGSIEDRYFRRPPNTSLIHPLISCGDKVYEKEISVIMGTYNRLECLKTAVSSVRRICSGVDYEIVVSDGGSTDGSVKWMKDQPDVRPLKGDLRGAAKAFSQCFEASKGRFILTLNDDAELSGENVKAALKKFDDPMVGQVAFFFVKRPSTEFRFEATRARLYANYGLIRSYIAEAIASICGGFWCPKYFTYGADTELSMWVHRLGYKVVEDKKVIVIDHQHNDRLRKKNLDHEQGMSSKVFGSRWPTVDHVAFRGPPPASSKEAKMLAALEAGETPETRWPRIASVDPRPREMPPRAPLSKERVLHVQIRTDDDPQSCMVAGLRSLGSCWYANIDWLKMSKEDLDRSIRRACDSVKPTLVFIQVQGPRVSSDLIRSIRRGPHDPSMVVAFWCGDIGWPNGPWAGFEDGWAHQCSKHSDVMLYTGTGQVDVLRKRGMKNAAYLQIGYDTDRYFSGPLGNYGKSCEIIFTGQNYGNHFDQRSECDGSKLRRAVVGAFRDNFRGFKYYGNGWGGSTKHMPQNRSGDLYRKSLMTVCVSLSSQLARYASDRLFRSLACGTPTLVKRFPDMAGLGLEHGKNCLVWDTIGEAVAMAKDWLRPHRRKALLSLGQEGAELAVRHHTWPVRMKELSAILQAVRGQQRRGGYANI